MSAEGWIQFFLGWGLTFTLYVIAQIAALWLIRGPVQWFLVVPIPIMAVVVYATAQAWSEHSSMWPLLLIVASPFALAYIVIVALAVALLRRFRREKPGELIP